jgi:hypothetical protein
LGSCSRELGFRRAATRQDGDGTGTGFLAVPAAGAEAPRAAVTWYENGEPTSGPDEPKLRECEQALRRAGFHVEYTTETTGGCLLAWRRTRTT